MSISENFLKVREKVPEEVTILLACKTRTPEEVAEVIAAGATDLGHNYVQEAEEMVEAMGDTAFQARWHMIGPLQKNKINKALRLVDVIQTVHSVKQAEAIDLRASRIDKVVSAFIEINSGRESNKSGIDPDFEEVKGLAEKISECKNLKLEGLMTMGPFLDDPEEIRPFFRITRELYDRVRDLNLPGADLKYLSMGMTDSYQVAIEEGSNMIRLGTGIFGPRPG